MNTLFLLAVLIIILNASASANDKVLIISYYSSQVHREVRDLDTRIWSSTLSYYFVKTIKDKIKIDSDKWIETTKTGIDKNCLLCIQHVVIKNQRNQFFYEK